MRQYDALGRIAQITRTVSLQAALPGKEGHGPQGSPGQGKTRGPTGVGEASAVYTTAYLYDELGVAIGHIGCGA